MTHVEIFTNPYDLEIVVGKESGGEQFLFYISRGPDHNFKMLISSNRLAPFADSQESCIGFVEKFLLKICGDVGLELENPESLVAKFINPDGEKIDQANVLNQSLIGRIVAELRQTGVASTYKMIPPRVE